MREVHGVADECVLESFFGAEQRGGDRTGREADAETERRQPALGPLRVELDLRFDHRDRGGERAVGVVVLRDRRAEARHHRVADELHHGAVLVEDRVVHRGAVLVEQMRERARIGGLGDARSSRGCPT